MPKVLNHKIIVLRDKIRNEYEFSRDEIVVGRDSTVDLNLKNDSLSRKHFKLTFKNQKVYVEDLGSQNGTIIDGTPIPPKTPRELNLNQKIVLPQGFLLTVVPSWVAEAAEEAKVLESENGGIKDQIATSKNQLKLIQERANSEVARLAELKGEQQEIEKENKAAIEKIHSLHLEIRRFENEKAKLIVQIEEIKTQVREQQEASKKEIAAILAELLENQNAIIDSRAERALAEEQMGDAKADLESVKSKAQKSAEKAESEKTRYEVFAQKIIEAENQEKALIQSKEKLQGTIQDLEAEIARLIKDRSNAQNLSQNAQKDLDTLRSEIQKEKERAAEGRAAAAVAERKERAEYEAYSAERRIERLRIEVECESIQVKKAVLEKDIQLLTLKKETIERENSETLKKVTDHETRVNKAVQRLEEIETKTVQAKAHQQSLESELETIKSAISKAEKERDELTQGSQTLEARIAARKKSFEQEMSDIRSKTQKEMQTLRQQNESEIAELKSRAQAEVTQLQTRAQSEVAEFTTKERNQLQERLTQEDKKIQAYYLEQIKLMDAKVAQRRLEEEKKIERFQDQSQINIRQKRQDAALAASHQATLLLGELFSNAYANAEPSQILAHFEKEIREAVFEALDPNSKSAGPKTIGSKESKKAQFFWVKLASGIGAVTAAGVLLALFPQLPKNVARTVYRKISSNKSDNVFMEEIHRKGEKFSPPTTATYKATYTDNVLYSERYLAMKTQSDMKKKWTLALNDFFIGTLGVGDRAIVDFVAAEAVLVGELASIQELTSVQFKELGIKKMHDTEKQYLPRLEDLVGGREGYAKFRNFERAFYEAYLK